MERKCSQTIKILFPVRTFYGTDIVIDVPRSGEAIKNIRVVLDFPSTLNTLGENIIERADLIVDGKEIESTYGEFIHVENNFNVSIEKYDKLNELLCVSNSGTMYLTIPFECTSLQNSLYFTEHGDVKLRLIFSNKQSGELNGYLLVDYFVFDNPPKFPYIQKTTQVQRLSRVCTNPKSLKMQVYVVGPVYQLYFTVKDLTTNKYVDAITNIKLYFGEKERFNLSGYYLRYIEPIKRLKTYSTEPMYMYSFCIDPKNPIPNGHTHFNEKSYFIIDFNDNQNTYEVTIWAKNHNFIYVTDKTIKPIFNSVEMLLDTVQEDVTNFKNVPLQISYINYATNIIVFYSSPYEISNVVVNTDVQNYNITQNTIEFTRIDSVNSEYTANIVFSSQGFSDTTCYFKFIGNNTYLSKIIYTPDCIVPTHIDLAQNFHYVYGNVFNFSNTIFTSNIQTFTIDDNRNYAFTTYTNGPCDVLGSSETFSGPGSIIAKYDKNMNLIFSYSFTNSNVTALENLNTFAIYGTDIPGAPPGKQGLITFRLNTDTESSIFTNAGEYSNVFIDCVKSTYVSARYSESFSNVFVSSGIDSDFGVGFQRTCLISLPYDIITVGNMTPVNTKTALDLFSNNKPVWFFMFNDPISSINFSTSNGYMLYTPLWTKTITNIVSTSLDPQLVVDKMTDNIYVFAGYDSTTPVLEGFTFVEGTGLFIIKFDRFGNVQFALSLIGTNIEYVNPVIDTTTGRFMMSITTSYSSPRISIYNNGSLIYSDIGKHQFFIFDDYGNLNSIQQNLNTLFNIPKPLYFDPLCNYNYFDSVSNTVTKNDYWVSALIGPGNGYVNSLLCDKSTNDLFVLSTISYGSSNIYDKYGDTMNYIYPTSSNDLVIYKLFSNCVYSNSFFRITNVGYSTNPIIKNNKIYINTTTNENSPTLVYDSNGDVAITLSDYTNSTVVIRFNLDGTYDNWYMIIQNTSSSGLTLDKNNILYVNGYKGNSSSQSIIINDVVVGSVPESVSSSVGFVIKLSLNDDEILWVSYIDNCVGVNSDVDSNGNVYISSSKPPSISNINGTTSFIPATSSMSSAFYIKLDSNGVYQNFNMYLEGLSNDLSSCPGLKINSNDEVLFGYSVGNLEGAPAFSWFDIYINGVYSGNSFNKIKDVSGGIIKFTNTGTFDWIIKIGTITGNSSFLYTFLLDRSDAIIISTQRQGAGQNIFDKNENISSLPTTTGDSGSVFRIENDGTFTNCYGYIDSVSFDYYNNVQLTNNDDIYCKGNFSIMPGLPGYNGYIYDKFGFNKMFEAKYNVGYDIILKYNSNFTLNKITI